MKTRCEQLESILGDVERLGEKEELVAIKVLATRICEACIAALHKEYRDPQAGVCQFVKGIPIGAIVDPEKLWGLFGGHGLSESEFYRYAKPYFMEWPDGHGNKWVRKGFGDKNCVAMAAIPESSATNLRAQVAALQSAAEELLRNLGE